MRFIFSIFFLFSALMPSAYGQLVYDWEKKAEDWEYRVKNIEFFIDRFNNQAEGSGSAHAANPKDTAACLAFMRERDYKLFSLFDLGRIDRNDAIVKQKINTFFREINSPYDPKFLRFEDSYWYAELNMRVESEKGERKMRCILQVVSLGQGSVGWAIKALNSPELHINERFYVNNLYFPPSVNGTDFMGVRLALNNPDWTKSKASKAEMPYSSTLQQLSDGKLKIQAITKITYHFLQLDGWIMTVNYVNRDSKNSGWLLEDLRQASNQQKVQYLKDLSID